MGRGQQAQATQLFNDSQDAYKTAQGNSSALYSKILPIFSAEATNPQGFSSGDLSAMNTASQQSVGGSTAGALSHGDLMAARTRNAGAFQPAEDEAVRGGRRQLSQNAVDIQGANARQRELTRQLGISGMGGLYGQNTEAMLKSLGLGTGAVNAGTEAGKSGWFQNLVSFINAGSNAASAAAGF